MKTKGFYIFLFLAAIKVSSCSSVTTEDSDKLGFTHFSEDSIKNEFRQLFENANNDQFLAVFFTEGPMAYSSGNKILVLYDKDSNAIEVNRYGCHPLEVIKWNDNTISISTYVNQVSYDNADQQPYIRTFTDQNPKLGSYKIEYITK